MAEKKTPFLSVIIPFYNTEEYLPRSIDSVLNQTFQDTEIILVDDGSTDRSGTIADEYAQQHPCITVLHTEHSGVSHARNAGLKAAQGTWIHFMDSDDYSDPDMYRILVQLIRKYSADIAVCRINDVYLNRRKSREEDGQEAVLTPMEALEEILTRKMDDSLCSKLIRRTLFESTAFREGTTYEDVRIMPELVLKAERIVRINRNLYFYWHRLNSVTTTLDPDSIADIIDACEDIRKRVPPSLEPAAEYRILASCFGVLDLILREERPENHPQYTGTVQYLKEHWKDIIHSPYFTLQRKAAALLLKADIRLYRRLISLKWKRQIYHP